MSSEIPIDISAYLMGEKVRFAGGHKRQAFAMDNPAPFVAFTTIYPTLVRVYEELKGQKTGWRPYTRILQE